jgi:uncharacterized protein YukE
MSRAGILGDLAIPGDPAEIAALSRALRRTTDHVTECENQLSAVSGNVDWRGDAADAYRAKLGSLPDELEKVRASYDEASWALWSYESTVRDLKSRSSWAESRAYEAQALLDAVTRARRSGHQDPRLDAEEQAARDQLNAAKREARGIHDEFESAVGLCCKRIYEASQRGIHNSFGTAFDRYVVQDAGGFLRDAGVGLWHTATDLPSAFEDFVEHPSLESFSRLLDDVTTIVAVLAIFIPGLQVAALGLSALQLGTDAAKGDWKKAGMDLLFLGVSGVGRVASSAGDIGGKAAHLQASRAAKIGAGQRHVVIARDLRDMYGAKAAAGMRPQRWAARSAASEFDLSSRYSLVRAGARNSFRVAPAAPGAPFLKSPVAAAGRWFRDYADWSPKDARLALRQGRPAALRFHHIGFVAGKVGDAESVRELSAKGREVRAQSAGGGL